MRVIVPCAGEGSRARRPYPKCLERWEGEPLLVRILRRMRPLGLEPWVVVSPTGTDPVRRALDDAGLPAALVVQRAPTGPGDAVRLGAAGATGDVLVVWGDMLDVRTETVRWVRDAPRSDLVLATAYVSQAYTRVERGPGGRVRAVRETRDAPVRYPGEQDVGVFRASPRFLACVADVGDGGWLSAIPWAVRRGLDVRCVDGRDPSEARGFNSDADLG